MIVPQEEVRARIEQLRLSYDGYRKQLSRPGISPERQERLETDVRLLDEEISTLEKIAQLGRMEPDRDRIEEMVRDRLDSVRKRLDADPALRGYTLDQRELTSGEVRALRWALREDTLTQRVAELMKGHNPDPSRTGRATPGILIHALEEGPSPDARASAAHDLGALHATGAIPSLVRALSEGGIVAQVALRALANFSPQELAEAGVDPITATRIAPAAPDTT